MSLAFSVSAAASAAACGWPAARVAAAFSVAGKPVTEGPAAEGPPAAGPPAAGPPAGRAARCGCALTALITGGLVLLVTLRLREELLATACGWLIVCGLPLSLIDLRVRRLPDPLTAACAAGLAVTLTAAAATSGQWQDLARAVAGAAALCLSVTLLALARPGSAGLGDAKLGLSTGALAAWFGWNSLLASVLAAFVLAACYGAGLWVAGRTAVRGGSVPFGPFLLAGCLVVVLLPGAAPLSHAG